MRVHKFLAIPLILVIVNLTNFPINAQQTYIKQHVGPLTLIDEIVDCHFDYLPIC